MIGHDLWVPSLQTIRKSLGKRIQEDSKEVVVLGGPTRVNERGKDAR